MLPPALSRRGAVRIVGAMHCEASLWDSPTSHRRARTISIPATPGDHTPDQECIAPSPRRVWPRGRARQSHTRCGLGKVLPVCADRVRVAQCAHCLAPTIGCAVVTLVTQMTLVTFVGRGVSMLPRAVLPLAPIVPFVG
jgi:hypothetical protein